MTLSSISATVGGTNKNLLVGSDSNNNLAPAHVLVNSSGTELGSQSNPLQVFVAGQNAYAVTFDNGTGLVTGQVTVTTTPTLICALRSGRNSVIVSNEGTTVVRLGGSNVSVTNGIALPGVQFANASFDNGAAIYGVVASGSQVVSFAETF